MKFVLAGYGTRGDVEPCVAVGHELLRRGHEVRMAVAPNLVGFAESAGLSAVAYGRWAELGPERDLCACFSRNFWKVRDLTRLWREVGEPVTRYWNEVSAALMSLADGADLLLTAGVLEQYAANVAECYDIPLAALHYFPIRPNGHVVQVAPPPLVYSATTVLNWLYWRWTNELDKAQRRELGLPTAIGPASRRMASRGSLEIQAYDSFCFPGLAAEWAKLDGRRPFVGALTAELATDDDDEVKAWIAAGTPPIYFGFGSVPVVSPAETLAMISAACAQVGERALVCAGATDFDSPPTEAHVKVVGAVSHSAVLPACRAVVHHGGTGTTAAGLRAGVPALVLWLLGDQPIWGNAVKRLRVGTARRFTGTTRESLVADLRTILAPQYLNSARHVASRMTEPAESAASAADLVENFARAGVSAHL